MTQTADRYGKVLYDLRVPAEDVEQMKAALCAAPQLVKILNDPTLTKEVKHGEDVIRSMTCWKATGPV